MDGTYLDRAKLVVQILPFVAEEPDFALKGGTAINLFESDLPRLSVDIDLAFVPVTDRETAVREIDDALSRICTELAGAGFAAHLSGEAAARKIICSRGGATVKIEPNYVVRGTVFPVRDLEIRPAAEERLGYCRMKVLSRDELYGGKFCAALDRQHPRDLFDVARFFERGGMVNEAKDGFVVTALGHARPLHELLAPNKLDPSSAFASQFDGMSDVPFSREAHDETFRRLVTEIDDALSGEDRERLLSFTALEADADIFGIPGLENLPAIRWKRRNLETLRKKNLRKFNDNVKALERTLSRSPSL